MKIIKYSSDYDHLLNISNPLYRSRSTIARTSTEKVTFTVYWEYSTVSRSRWAAYKII